MKETCNRLIKALDDVADKNETFEVREILGKFSMDTIASCAFGVDAQVFANDKSDFVQHASQIFKTSASGALKAMLQLLPFDLGIYFRRLLNISFSPKKEIEFFYDTVLDVLKSRQKSGSRRNDLIDLMLDAVKGDISEENDDHSHEQFEKVQIKSTTFQFLSMNVNF